jgi:hypothetical protein
VLVAIAVVLIGTSPWRWLVVLHPVLTFVVVAATGNHWWLDGVAAIAVLGVVALVEWGARGALTSRLGRRRPPVAVSGAGPIGRTPTRPMVPAVAGPPAADDEPVPASTGP